MKRNPLSYRARLWYDTKILIWATCWGFPIGCVGCLAMITVVGIPVGVVLLIIAAWPLQRMVINRQREVTEWRRSPTPGLTIGALEEELQRVILTDRPWEE